MAASADAAALLESALAFLGRGDARAACAVFQKASELDPGAAARRGWGEALARLGNTLEALDKYQDALVADPEDEKSYDALERALADLDDPPSVVARFQSLVDGFGNSVAQARWGRVLVTRKLWGAAVAHYEKANASSASDLANWGRALLGSRRDGDALEKFVAALQQDPVLAVDALSSRLLETLQAVARDDLDKWITRFQSLVDGSRRWAKVLTDLGRYEDAGRQYRRIAEQRPKDTSALVELAKVLGRSGHEAEAIELYDEALARNAPLDWSTRSALQQSLALMDERSPVIARLDTTVRRVGTADTVLEWIDVLLDLDENQAAAQTAEWASARRAGSAEHLRWGRALLKLGDLVAAARKAAEALKLAPENDEAVSLLVEALQGLDHPVGLLRELEAVVAARNDPAADQAWAAVLKDLKYYRQAVEQFERKPPRDAAGYLMWGQALAELGEHTGALAKYEAALALDPEQPQAYELLTASLGPLPLGTAASAAVGRLQEQIDRLDRVDAFLAWGRVLDELGEHEGAVTQYERAAARNPDAVVALAQLGDALVALGRYDEALIPYTQVVAKTAGSGNPVWGPLLKALTHLDAEDEAVTTFQRTVDAIDGGHVYRQWGTVLFRLDRPSESLVQYEKCHAKGSGGAPLDVDIGDALSELERFGEAVARYQRALPKMPVTSAVQERLGNAYRGQRDLDRANRHYQEAARLGSLFAAFNWALTLNELRRVEDANAQYQSLIRTCETILDQREGDVVAARFLLPYARYNLASIRHEHGEYAASRPAWQDTANAFRLYNEEIADPDHFMYAAQLLREIDQDYQTAQQYLSRGLALNPKHTGLLAGLVKVYLAQRDEARPTADGDARGRAHRGAWDAYWKAERILNGRITRAETGRLLLELGELHASVGEHSKAIAALQKAVTKNPDMAGGYQALGAVCMRMEDAKAALGHFKAALDRAPGNLETWASLAEASLKTNLPEKAEAEYKKILAIAPVHQDSLLGLGQVYLTMGETQMSRDNKADAEGMFIRSSEQLARAILLHDQNTGSRRLSEAELATARYSCGYALVTRYEIQALVKKDESLLQEARQNFDKIPDSDVNHHKARRAISKIDERLKPPRLLAEQWGAWMVVSAAVVMFLIGLGAFVLGRPVWAGGFLITEQALEELKQKGAPDDLIKKLKPLEGRHLPDQGQLTEELRKAGGEAAAAKFGVQLATTAAIGTAIQGWRPVETGYAVLLMFGSVIFMVAGLYLQQISKLKFGGLELEKSSGDQIKVATSLGISK